VARFVPRRHQTGARHHPDRSTTWESYGTSRTRWLCSTWAEASPRDADDVRSNPHVIKAYLGAPRRTHWMETADLTDASPAFFTRNMHDLVDRPGHPRKDRGIWHRGRGASDPEAGAGRETNRLCLRSRVSPESTRLRDRPTTAVACTGPRCRSVPAAGRALVPGAGPIARVAYSWINRRVT